MRIPAGVLLLALLVVVAACGGENGKQAEAPPPTPPAPAAQPSHAVRAPDAEATRSVALARAALEAVGRDARLGVLLAQEAGRVAATPEAREALHRTLAVIEGDAAFHAHRGSTLTATFSPDGRYVLTTSLDFDARLWTPQGEPVALLRGHGGKVLGGVFSPDGTRVLTWSVDHTARLWDLEGHLLHTLEGHTGELLSAAFAHDGKRVLTVSLDGTARLFGAAGEPLSVIRYEDDAVRSAHLLDVPTGARPLVVVTERGLLDRIGLDEDDRPRAGTYREWSAEKTVVARDARRWIAVTDLAGAIYTPSPGADPVEIHGHAAQILDAAFAPDGERFVTGSLDSTARIWGEKGEEVAVLRGHGGAVFSVAFSPDGTRVLTVSWDRTARLWDLEGHALAAIGSKETPVVAASFSPRGDAILTLPYHTGAARLWDLEGRLLEVLPDDSGRTLAASFSADGERVLLLDRHLVPHVFVVGDVAAEAERLLAGRSLTPEERLHYQELLRPGTVPTPAQADFAAVRPEPDTKPARGDSAGTVECAKCHRQAYEGWVHSSHARTSFFATEEVLPPDVLEGKTVEHPPGHTSFRKEGDHWIARTVGEDGEEHDYDLTMVSGHLRVRFFMTRMPDGRLQVLPAMYELPTGEWFDYTQLLFGAAKKDFDTAPVVAPGDPSFWTGPVRSWDARCAHCHMSGKTPVDPGPGGVGPRIIARAYAVDCESCHGPARLHAEAWNRLEMDETLEKLETWSRERRVSLCTQCHQEGEVLDPPYVPGKPLYEYIDPTLVIDPERADPAGRPTELIYDGLPFSTSHCANSGGLTCSDCHAPHGSETRSLLRHPPEDGSFCVKCHEDLVKDAAAHSHHQPTGSGAQCVLCHMPFLTIERGHGAVADHTIGIPRLGLVADRVQPDACTWCHGGGLHAPHDAPALMDDELWRAYESWWPGRGWPRPWMAALASARLGEADAGPRLVEVIRNARNPREVRASAALLLGRYADTMADAIFDASRDPDSLVRRSAIKSLLTVTGAKADARLLEALDDPSWAVRVAAARTALEGWTRVQANHDLLVAAAPVLDRDARLVPDDDRRWFRLGAAYELLGDREKALEAYEHKVRLDPFSGPLRKHVKDLRALLGLDTDD